MRKRLQPIFGVIFKKNFTFFNKTCSFKSRLVKKSVFWSQKLEN